MAKDKKKDKASGGKKKGGVRVEKGDVLAPDQVVALARAAAFTDEAPDKAFAHFRPLAEALSGEQPVFTSQALLMRANIKQALEAVEPHLPSAVAALPGHKLQDVLELPSLVMALDFAAGRVPLAKLSTKEIEKLLAEGAPWREQMLSYLEVASHPLLNLLPRERVAAVRAGTGKLDTAQDFVALAGLFAEFAPQLEGKHPFPKESIDRLASLGGLLVQQLKPGQAVTTAPKRSPEAILRDRFATLVADRYDHLQVLATVAVGKRKADELLPALRSTAPSARTPDEKAPDGSKPVDGQSAAPS